MILNKIETLISICEEDSAAKKWTKRALIGGAVGTAGLAGAAKLGLLGQHAQNVVDNIPGNLKAAGQGFRAGQTMYDATQQVNNQPSSVIDRLHAGVTNAKDSYNLSDIAQNKTRETEAMFTRGAIRVKNALN